MGQKKKKTKEGTGSQSFYSGQNPRLSCLPFPNVEIHVHDVQAFQIQNKLLKYSKVVSKVIVVYKNLLGVNEVYMKTCLELFPIGP